MGDTSYDDYYAILQVSSDARKEVIDAAYRKLAQIYHPDVNKSPDAEEKMKKINYAHEILSDHAKRAAYDATRYTAVQGQKQGQFKEKRGFFNIIALMVTILIIVVIAAKLGIKPAIIISVISIIIWAIYSLLPEKKRNT